ncbi:hypothetical protein ACFYXL_28375 [Streptomyces tsukubensis]|uniref:hypothetical protein n=1 Tax=Streptomyces tsukubensis TaxID=83656 RepID=UPI0036B25291
MNELAELKRRLSAIERAPAPESRFDRYPVVEWATRGRPPTGGNIWSSVGVANVTGMTFDRVETKFITDNLYTGRREAEVRLAAFRHTGRAEREIVSASSVLNLTGTTNRVVGVVVMRWVHGIPFGWDYDTATTVYTIELQHRYRKGPEDPKGRTMYTIAAPEGSAVDGNILNWGYQDNFWITSYKTGSPWAPDFVTVPNADEGSYNISPMHYCVGLPQTRIPEADEKGWAWTRGTNSSWGRDPDITEPHMSV